MCITCSALFRHILKEVRVLLTILRRRYEKQLAVRTRIWPFSVQSLQERVFEFAISTTDTRALRVNGRFRGRLAFALHGPDVDVDGHHHQREPTDAYSSQVLQSINWPEDQILFNPSSFTLTITSQPAHSLPLFHSPCLSGCLSVRLSV